MRPQPKGAGARPLHPPARKCSKTFKTSLFRAEPERFPDAPELAIAVGALGVCKACLARPELTHTGARSAELTVQAVLAGDVEKAVRALPLASARLRGSSEGGKGEGKRPVFSPSDML